ncbi:MAG: hypothetical protein V3U03_07780 [Myxococcota bacterium]
MRVSVALLLLSMAVAAPAHAIRCRDWGRLGVEQREDALRSEFRQVMSSNRAKQFTSINKTRIERCLIRSMAAIEDDFDDACAEGLQKSMGVLDEILMNYVRSCANER